MQCVGIAHCNTVTYTARMQYTLEKIQNRAGVKPPIQGAPSDKTSTIDAKSTQLGDRQDRGAQVSLKRTESVTPFAEEQACHS